MQHLLGRPPLQIMGDTGEAIHKHQGVGCACEIRHASRLSTPGDAQMTEAA